MPTVVLVLTFLGLAAACARGPRAITVDPGVGFAMHQESREFVLDRPVSVPPASVTPASWFRAPGDATWALRRGGSVLAAYWVDGDAGTTARAGLRSSDRPIGDVRPSWDDNAIRLRLEAPGGGSVRSDVFSRTDGGGGPSALSRAAHTILEVRGRYRAALRDASGTEVGWLGVRIGPYEQAARVYEGALPAAVGVELAVAAVISLASEIDWIESHSINVYQGDRGSLSESYPIH